MKRVHPDRPGHGGPGAEARAKRINEAFAVLKDPAKRALYDAELERDSAAKRAQASPALRPAAYVTPVPAQVDPRRPKSGRGVIRGLLLVVALAGAVFAGFWPYRDRLRNAPLLTRNPPPASVPGQAGEEAGYDRPILEPDIIDAIADAQWVLDFGTAEDAAQYSRGCFDELRSYPVMRLLDRCIAFDFAWKHQLKGPASGGLSPYFAAPAMNARHVRQARALDDGEEMNEARLKSLEALTIATLARVADASPASSGDGG